MVALCLNTGSERAPLLYKSSLSGRTNVRSKPVAEGFGAGISRRLAPLRKLRPVPARVVPASWHGRPDAAGHSVRESGAELLAPSPCVHPPRLTEPSAGDRTRATGPGRRAGPRPVSRSQPRPREPPQYAGPCRAGGPTGVCCPGVRAAQPGDQLRLNAQHRPQSVQADVVLWGKPARPACVHVCVECRRIGDGAGLGAPTVGEAPLVVRRVRCPLSARLQSTAV